MTLKTYQAATMAQALAEVKRDLGRDAVILHTRTFRRGGLLGFWRRRMWEVTASPNLNVPQRITAGKYESARDDAEDERDGEARDEQREAVKTAIDVPAGDGEMIDAVGAQETRESERKTRGGEGETMSSPCGNTGEKGAGRGGNERFEDPAALAAQVQDIRQMVQRLLQTPGQGGADGAPGGLPMEVRHLLKQLVDQDIDPAVAETMLKQLCMGLTGEQLGDRRQLQAECRKFLASRLRTSETEPTRPRRAGRAQVISLIGPTGVGKTTTIAKLAANYKLREGKTVGLITIDTYRIAAVDQLRTYADIIEVPLKAVLTAGELHQAVESMREMDVILIDTAGRSQNNRLRLSQLKSFIGAAEPDEVHLVVSATANRACTKTVLDRFMPLGANRIIVTKLDEAGSFGVFLTVSEAGGGPISYVTTGQDVPEDIARASAETLAECILTGRFGVEAHGG